MVGSIWNGITPGGQGSGDRIKTDHSIPGGDYVGECVEFFAYFDKPARCHKCKFAFTISTGPQAGQHLVRWAQTGGHTGEKQTKNRQHLAGDFMHTLGRLPEFTQDTGLANQDQVRAGIVGAICKLRADPWIGNDGQARLSVYINDTIQHGGIHLEDPDRFRDTGEPADLLDDPFATPAPEATLHGEAAINYNNEQSDLDDMEDVPF